MRSDSLNIQHADNPKVGDFWHEMYAPIARVLMVDDRLVLIQKLAGYGGCEVSDADPKPVVMSRRSFAKWVRYKTIPDKTWPDVVPEKFATRT